MKWNVLFAFIALVAVTGCETLPTKRIPVKPFIVIDKGFGGYTRTDCWFEVIDSKGNSFIFEDQCKWYLGDTIK
jgi:hypothetical protein